VIEVCGRKFRDLMDLYSTWSFEQHQADRKAAPVAREVEPNEDRRALLDAIEAGKHAHDPITDQERFDSGAKVFGAKTMRDWETFHDQ